MSCRSAGGLALAVKRKWLPALRIGRPVRRGRTIASPVTAAPSGGRPFRSVIAALIPFVSGSTAGSPTTAPRAVAMAESACRAFSSRRLEPRDFSPSIATSPAPALPGTARPSVADRASPSNGVKKP
ncbi:MAG: hypothetical protein IT545_14315 [Rhodobacteraceae bacterium]|nr:hypothetical protein [Paracoccaceae bacterium]